MKHGPRPRPLTAAALLASYEAVAEGGEKAAFRALGKTLGDYLNACENANQYEIKLSLERFRSVLGKRMTMEQMLGVLQESLPEGEQLHIDHPGLLDKIGEAYAQEAPVLAAMSIIQAHNVYIEMCLHYCMSEEYSRPVYQAMFKKATHNLLIAHPYLIAHMGGPEVLAEGICASLTDVQDYFRDDIHNGLRSIAMERAYRYALQCTAESLERDDEETAKQAQEAVHALLIPYPDALESSLLLDQFSRPFSNAAAIIERMKAIGK